MRWRAIIAALGIMAGAAACSAADPEQPSCSRVEDSILVLVAQSVPSSTRLPCIAELPIGWRFGGSLVRDDSTTLWLDHDRGGIRAVEVELTADCDVATAIEVPPAPDEIGMRTYQAPVSLDPFVGTRSLVFEGGCIRYHYRFAAGSEPALVIEADRALSTLPREEIVAHVRTDFDLSVCGAEAPACAE